MPFSMISALLGSCFALVWIFIGAMIVQDSQIALRRDRESDTLSDFRLPTVPKRSPPGPHIRLDNAARQKKKRRPAHSS